jgi:hypothetical protein
LAVGSCTTHLVAIKILLESMAQQSNSNAVPAASAEMPPAMAEIKSQDFDTVLQEMNRMPLFMTNLDESDGEGGQNDALEALKALAYEGTRAEVAENFRQQGNECARAKQWTDAKDFYDKALAALKGPQNNPDPDAKGPDVIEVELDEAEEAKKEKVIEEACHVNRALCNLEKSQSTMLLTCQGPHVYFFPQKTTDLAFWTAHKHCDSTRRMSKPSTDLARPAWLSTS